MENISHNKENNTERKAENALDILKFFKAIAEVYKARGIDLTFRVKKKGEGDDAFVEVSG